MAQIEIRMVLPKYIKATMCQDGVLIAVTRQISEDYEVFFQKFLPEAEIFSFEGRKYVRFKKVFTCYPTDPSVLKWAKSAHKDIMDAIDLSKASYFTNRVIMRSKECTK